MKNILNRIFRRGDSWENHFTGLGISSSRTSSTKYLLGDSLDRLTLTELYRTNGLAKRIVNLLVDDAMRGFIKCEEELTDELKRVKAKQALFNAASFGRLYGGAIIVAFIDDGLDLEKPLDTKRLNKLVSLRAFDRHQISWTNEDLCNDFYKEWYGEPEIYTITNNQNGVIDNELFFKVHRSRCHIFGADRIANSSRKQNQGWDNPVLQSCYEMLKNHGIIVGTSVEIVQDFVQVIIKMNGLMDKVSAGQEGVVQSRIDIIDRTRSTQNTILLDGDGDEDYEKRASSVAGLADLWSKADEALCSATPYSVTKLFGRSPAGMNATGVSDRKNYNDVVSAYRENEIEPCITWLLDILESQKDWKNKPDSFDWEFPALEEPSEIELADIKKKYAEIDSIYIDRGAISASEAWQERFGDGEFKYNIKLSSAPTDIIELPKDEDDNEEIEEEADLEYPVIAKDKRKQRSGNGE